MRNAVIVAAAIFAAAAFAAKAAPKPGEEAPGKKFSFAQGPSGEDNFDHPTPIEGLSGWLRITLSKPAGAQNSEETTVWFLWKPPHYGYTVIDTIESSESVEASITVYSGSKRDELTLISDKDALSERPSKKRVSFKANAQETYRIAVRVKAKEDAEVPALVLAWNQPVSIFGGGGGGGGLPGPGPSFESPSLYNRPFGTGSLLNGAGLSMQPPLQVEPTFTIDLENRVFKGTLTIFDRFRDVTAVGVYASSDVHQKGELLFTLTPGAIVGGQFGQPQGMLWEIDQTLTDEEIAELKAGAWFLDVATTSAPGGEIRMPLQVVPEPSVVALLVLGGVLAAGWRGLRS